MDDGSIQLHLLSAQEEALALNNAATAPPPRTRLTTWTWETDGIIVSSTLLVALVIVLRRYEGNREPAWNHMSLNTLIAWVSTVARA
jgi:hypothetical protein